MLRCSCLTLCDPMDCSPQAPLSMGILQARILEWIAMPSSRRSSPTQGSNPGLLHRRWILYNLNYQGHPRILEWVAYPFSRGSSWPRSQTEVSCIADGFFTCWVPGKPLFFSLYQLYGQLNYKNGQWDKVIKTMDSKTRLLCNREQIT